LFREAGREGRVPEFVKIPYPLFVPISLAG